MRFSALCVVMSAVVWIGVAAAAEPLLPAADLQARVAAAADTVVLTTGRQVRLVGSQAPKLLLGRVGFTAWPLAEEA